MQCIVVTISDPDRSCATLYTVVTANPAVRASISSNFSLVLVANPWTNECRFAPGSPFDSCCSSPSCDVDVGELALDESEGRAEESGEVGDEDVNACCGGMIKACCSSFLSFLFATALALVDLASPPIVPLSANPTSLIHLSGPRGRYSIPSSSLLGSSRTGRSSPN